MVNDREANSITYDNFLPFYVFIPVNAIDVKG